MESFQQNRKGANHCTKLTRCTSVKSYVVVVVDAGGCLQFAVCCLWLCCSFVVPSTNSIAHFPWLQPMTFRSQFIESQSVLRNLETQWNSTTRSIRMSLWRCVALAVMKLRAVNIVWRWHRTTQSVRASSNTFASSFILVVGCRSQFVLHSRAHNYVSRRLWHFVFIHSSLFVSTSSVTNSNRPNNWKCILHFAENPGFDHFLMMTTVTMFREIRNKQCAMSLLSTFKSNIGIGCAILVLRYKMSRDKTFRFAQMKCCDSFVFGGFFPPSHCVCVFGWRVFWCCLRHGNVVIS